MSTEAPADEIIFAHHAGRTTAFVRGDASAQSSFGGSIASALAGARFGPRPLQQIGQLALADLHWKPELKPYTSIPLLYGMSFDGCDLSYRVSKGGIDVEFISPDQSLDDWPHRDYPLELPFAPLAGSRVWEESWAEFKEARIPNLNEWATPKITIVVPPPKTLGFSLWGPEGDAEGVTIVFQYSPDEDSVRAFNLCG